MVNCFPSNLFLFMLSRKGVFQVIITSVSSVTQLCPTLWNPVDCSTPGLPVHHQLRVYSNSCPLSRWCHPTISSSVVPFSSHLQSFPASGSFQMSQLTFVHIKLGLWICPQIISLKISALILLWWYIKDIQRWGCFHLESSKFPVRFYVLNKFSSSAYSVVICFFI